MRFHEYYLALAWCILAAAFDAFFQGILASLVVTLIGFGRFYKAVVKGRAGEAGWRLILPKTAAPMQLMLALPLALVIGWAFQDIALSKAERLRLALLERLPKQDFYQAYNDLCPNKCGFFSYTIIPAKLPTPDGRATLIVMQFGDHRAKVDVASGNVENDDRTY